MLVRRLCADVLLHRATPSTIWIASIEHMQNDVRRIDDLVELVPDTLRRSLHEDELAGRGELAVGGAVDNIAGRARQQLLLLQTFDVGVLHSAGATSKVFDRAEVQL